MKFLKKPKRFWFYNDWDAGWATGSDEHGHVTFVVPLGKGRALVVAWLARYKGPFLCQDCKEARWQTYMFEQDALYAQTYFNIEDYDEIDYLDNWEWQEALGVTPLQTKDENNGK